jgi:glucokinase
VESRALVLDIGGSHVTAALVDLEKRTIVAESLRRNHIDSAGKAEKILNGWASVATKVLGQTTIDYIGVAMPDPFEYDTGVSRMHHKFAALYGVNVGTALKEKLSLEVPIYFGNDASLFALGEWWAGAAKNHSNVIGVTLGTGLGGGFVRHGKVCYGGEGVPPQGVIWNLSYLNGIAEDCVSGPALVKNYQSKTGTKLNPAEIAKEAREGNTNAQESYLELGTHLGKILNPWVTAFDATCLVIGGNIARSWDLFAPKLQETLTDKVLKVVSSTLFEEATLFGAAAMGLSQ